jgi:molybdopterin synthase catalytic subunit
VISYVDLNQLKATSEGLAIGAILIYLGLVKKEDLQK